MNTQDKQYRIDNAFGWQVDRPVFVRKSFNAFGKTWDRGENFNWINQAFRAEDWEQQLHNVHNLYLSGFVHHDTSKEQQNKVGDRLSEFNPEKLYSLVQQMNYIVKAQTNSQTEYTNKKIKTSKIADKQRGILRRWLYSNGWAHEEFYKIRDSILERKTVVSEE